MTAAMMTPWINECYQAGIRAPEDLDRSRAKKEKSREKEPKTAPQFSLVKPADFGPPALPFLMLRAARRAVAASPRDLASQKALLSAFETRRVQEDCWYGAPSPPGLRSYLRQLQKLSSITTLVHLPVVDSLKDRKMKYLDQEFMYELQVYLAQYYEQHFLMDLALDYWQMAEKSMEDKRSQFKDLTDPTAGKILDEQIKQFQQLVKAREKQVQLHLAKLKEQSAGKTPLQIAQLARVGSYIEIVNEQERRIPLALGKKAAEILATMKPPPPEENHQRLNMLYNLMLEMGRVSELARHLRNPEVAKMLRPDLLADYQIKVGAVIGDFGMMSKGLEAHEAFAAQFIHKNLSPLAAGIPGATTPSAPGSIFAALNLLDRMYEFHHKIYDAMALRGIAAVEAGDTKTARAVLRSLMDRAGTLQIFVDRRIAQRLLELLEEQAK
jgi:hypothetical protein